MAAVTYEIIRSSLFALIFLLYHASSIKLNVPRVLLPYSQSVSANFTLEVTDGGCFRWYLSRPEVIKLHVVDSQNKGCSSTAIVSSISKVPTLQSTLVTLINDESGESLHCDVAVTSINRLEITKTTGELLLEDTPEKFIIRALDNEGDTFSSLDGLVFEWNLITAQDEENSMDARYVLKFIKFSESLYKASPAIYALEAQNKRGFTVLVQGIKTGSAIVRASLKDSAYPSGLSTEVALSVVANLILSPSYEVHVLVGSVITYQVLVIQQGKSQKIQMPSTQFVLKVSDTNVAFLNSATSEVEALTIGYTEVILKDQNVKTRQLFRQPSAGIHVVLPHHIEFTLLPFQNWQLINKNRYVVLVKIYDKNNSEIYPTDNVRIEVEFPKEFFQIYHKTDNGSYYEFSTLTTGITKIHAILKGIVNKNGVLIEPNQLIEDSQDVEIVDKVVILPELVILPWNPLVKSSYELYFKASGGGNSGYHWKTNNVNVAVCNQDGMVSTKMNGSVNVTALSARNHYNYAVATIHILRPFTLEILTPSLEVEVGKIIDIPVALYTHFGSAQLRKCFTECVQHQFDVEIADTHKLEYLSMSDDFDSPKTCAKLPVKGLKPGFTKISVSFDNGDEILKNSTVVAVYRPLTIIYPVDDDMVLLTLGATLLVVFEGGPRAFHNNPRNFFRNLEIMNITVVSAKLNQNVDGKLDDLHFVTVVCKELGETVVTLRIGNHKTSSNANPIVSESTIRVLCQVPFSMELKPLVHRPKMSHLPSCQYNEHKISVQCYRDLDIAVAMFDQQGRQFDNFTSIAVDWQISNSSLADITKEQTLIVVENLFDGYKTLNHTYQTLFPRNIEGTLKVTARASSYLPRIAKYFVIENNFELVADLHLELVNDAHFVEEEIAVFNHPQNKVLLTVAKGSGQFDFQPKDQAVASVQYDDKLHEFVIVPKTEGSFALTLYDLCLETRSHASSVVRVSGIHKIEVNMFDKVGVNKEIVATVRIVDKERVYLPSSIFHLLDVKAVPASNIISIMSLNECGSLKNELCFAVLGKTLGQTMLTFVVTRKHLLPSDKLIETTKSSDPLPIQVFPPLRLHPRNVTLIIGAAFQISSSGGPFPQSSIEYFMENSEIASVNSAGIITGLNLGKTTIIVHAVGIDSESGSSVVYSQDQLNIFVIPLTGIRIRTRLSRLQTGSMIPVYAIGIHDYETPFTFGSALPYLRFKWTLNNKDIASLEPLYQQCGLQLQDDNQFMTRIRGKQPGQVTIQLKVSVTVSSQKGQFQISSDEVLVDELQLEVFEKLRFTQPVKPHNQEIIIGPNTVFKLQTNKDQLGFKITYRLLDTTCREGLGISVDDSGNLRSSQSICRSSLIVTSSDESGFNQTISSLVFVKPISYMMIIPTCFLHTKREALFVLPVGTRTMFKVHFYDNFGEEFMATNSRLKFSLSRNDLLQIIQGSKNGTFYIKINKPGYTILRVWDAKNLGIDDFILISSEEVIQPLRTVLTLGDVVCFSSPLTSADGDSGSWHSDNANIMLINSKSGVGFATNVGSTTVTHTTSVETSTKTEVNIVSVQSITFHPINSGKYLSNVFPTQSYFFPLVLHSEDPTQFSNLRGKNCEFDENFDLSKELLYKCNIKYPPDLEYVEPVFHVSEMFDLKTGRHGCIVNTKRQTSEVLQKMSTIKTTFTLTAEMQSLSNHDVVVSEKLLLVFNPAFFVFNEELRIGGAQSINEYITVAATDNVFNYITISSNDSKLVEVGPPESHHTDSSKRQYLIRLSDKSYQRFGELSSNIAAAQINVTCSLTKQVISIPVIVTAVGDDYEKCRPIDRNGWASLFSAIAESYFNIIFIVLAMSCTGIALMIGYYAILKTKSSETPGVYNSSRFASGEGRLYPAASRSFNGSHMSDRTHLWSVNEPVHGSPSFSRTPSPGFRNASERY